MITGNCYLYSYKLSNNIKNTIKIPTKVNTKGKTVKSLFFVGIKFCSFS